MIIMLTKVLICPHCGQDNPMKCGVNAGGEQLYACQNPMCKRKNISSHLFHTAKCRFCGGEDVSKRGQTPTGRILISCNNPDCKNKKLAFLFSQEYEYLK
jgi:hypothetical protein